MLVDSPRTDLCLISEDGLDSAFDPDQVSITYSATRNAMTLTPPGEYKFTITATLTDGGGIIDSGFSLTFVDPCQSPTAKVITTELVDPPLYVYGYDYLEY